jgi:acyl-CoA reductase-like NAD-dependent aldehyde dehydrogenase
MKLNSINPSNYEQLGEIDVSDESEIKKKVKLANDARLDWKNTTIDKRIKLLTPVFDEFKYRKNELAELVSKEMGMPINNSLNDVDEAISYADWYFNNAEKYLGPEITGETDHEIHTVYHEPIGVSAVMISWNFPFSNVVWAVLQGLIAGNVTVIKHSEECPLSGKFIEKVFSNHDFKGVFNEVYGDGEVGKRLIHQEINMIHFIGGSATGRYVCKVAGERLLKANMELGGSAPGIIFDDADIERVIGSVCELRLFNCGQVCNSLKRLIVHESIVDTVKDKITDVFSQKKIGNALDKSTEIGPLASKKQLELLICQVEDAVERGAKVLVGGKSLEKKSGGAFYTPTLLTNISRDMRVWQEEVFGPVLPIATFTTEKEAIMLANDTQYGLGAYVFSEDKEKTERVAQAIDSGIVSINGCNYIIPSNPFGGYKASGLGRQHGKYGFYDVSQTKLVATPK